MKILIKQYEKSLDEYFKGECSINNVLVSARKIIDMLLEEDEKRSKEELITRLSIPLEIFIQKFREFEK